MQRDVFCTTLWAKLRAAGAYIILEVGVQKKMKKASKTGLAYQIFSDRYKFLC